MRIYICQCRWPSFSHPMQLHNLPNTANWISEGLTQAES